VKRYTRTLSTPLVFEHPKKTPVLAVSIAASIESFYRAALNAVLNQQLTGKPATSYFPNMHIQIPTRILYINGFKGIRQYLDQLVRMLIESIAYTFSTTLKTLRTQQQLDWGLLLRQV
jgi:hypothetical protein